MLDAASLMSRCAPIFAAHPRVRAAFLFGSVARNTHTTASDVDIAVVGQDIDLFALGADLSVLLGREVDVVDVSDQSAIPLLRAVVKDGKPIYEAERGAATHFRSRAITVLELDGPAYDYMSARFLERVARRGVGA